jgi:hypothetical protein
MELDNGGENVNHSSNCVRLLCLAVLFAGCDSGSDSGGDADAAVSDAGTDAGSDAAIGSDADAGPALDGGTDAGSDAAIGSDADAGPALDGGTTTWTTTARNGAANMVQTIYICPANPGAAGGSVWGTDIYTDDSSICRAAVHFGVLTAATGGTITVEIRPGEASYAATTRNGITTSSWGSWNRSFVLIP